MTGAAHSMSALRRRVIQGACAERRFDLATHRLQVDAQRAQRTGAQARTVAVVGLVDEAGDSGANGLGRDVVLGQRLPRQVVLLAVFISSSPSVIPSVQVDDAAHVNLS